MTASAARPRTLARGSKGSRTGWRRWVGRCGSWARRVRGRACRSTCRSIDRALCSLDGAGADERQTEGPAGRAVLCGGERQDAVRGDRPREVLDRVAGLVPPPVEVVVLDLVDALMVVD